MQNSFFENTYASYVRMYYQKTFDAMLATPLSIGDIIAGEIIWGATKSVIAAIIMTLVLTPFGLVTYPYALLVPFIAVLGGIGFGSLGMLFTAKTPSIEVFNIPVFLFVTPMFLFSGTFFPLESLPGWAGVVAQLFPLTHLVLLVRSACLGRMDSSLMVSIVYLLVFAGIFFPISIAGMRKRLVK
jgi:lipooligosaccharide transport system permease protein